MTCTGLSYSDNMNLKREKEEGGENVIKGNNMGSQE
jgi:hypothetical protein